MKITKKILTKLIEVAVSDEIKTDMDLNTAAELLDNIDKQMKGSVMKKIQKPKKLHKIPSKLYTIAVRTTPFIFMIGLICFISFNRTSELPEKKQIAKVYGYSEQEIIQEDQSEWLMSEQLSEYELGMNTVEYFEDMMPRVDDEEIQSRVDDIKDELVQVITLRDGVEEIEIIIVESDEVGAWALPGGFVILTDSFYRMCKTDDELASILGHEIAHIVQGHVNNPMEGKLQAQYTDAIHNLGLEVGLAFTDEYAAVSAEGMVNMVTKQKELDADKHGILYTTLAGYDVNASLDIIDKAVEEGEGTHHPSKEVRMKKLNERIGEFISSTDYFHAGVQYFREGNLDYATKAFRSFLQVFPSREVHNNLGVIWYLKAHRTLPMGKISTAKTIQIDTETLADNIVLRGSSGERTFKRYLYKAEKRFKGAIERDDEYAAGYFNLSCVYDDLGEYALSKIYLEKANQYGYSDFDCQNTLASILIHEGKLDEAEQILNGISDVPESFFNLGVVALKRNDMKKAKEFFNEYENRAEDFRVIYIEYARTFDNYN
jgi:predicted Zn-dependent protease